MFFWQRQGWIPSPPHFGTILVFVARVLGWERSIDRIMVSCGSQVRGRRGFRLLHDPRTGTLWSDFPNRLNAISPVVDLRQGEHTRSKPNDSPFFLDLPCFTNLFLNRIPSRVECLIDSLKCRPPVMCVLHTTLQWTLGRTALTGQREN